MQRKRFNATHFSTFKRYWILTVCSIPLLFLLIVLEDLYVKNLPFKKILHLTIYSLKYKNLYVYMYIHIYMYYSISKTSLYKEKLYRVLIFLIINDAELNNLSIWRTALLKHVEYNSKNAVHIVSRCFFFFKNKGFQIKVKSV